MSKKWWRFSEKRTVMAAIAARNVRIIILVVAASRDMAFPSADDHVVAGARTSFDLCANESAPGRSVSTVDRYHVGANTSRILVVRAVAIPWRGVCGACPGADVTFGGIREPSMNGVNRDCGESSERQAGRLPA